MQPDYTPLSLPGRVYTEDAQLRPGALSGGLSAPQTILAADGRYTHCVVGFQWSRARASADEYNWDGVVLSLWAKLSFQVEVELLRFTIGAVGMQTVTDSGGSPVARSALVFSAQDVLCDAFILKAQSPSASQAYSGGFASIEAWARGFDCGGNGS